MSVSMIVHHYVYSWCMKVQIQICSPLAWRYVSSPSFLKLFWVVLMHSNVSGGNFYLLTLQHVGFLVIRKIISICAKKKCKSLDSFHPHTSAFVKTNDIYYSKKQWIVKHDSILTKEGLTQCTLTSSFWSISQFSSLGKVQVSDVNGFLDLKPPVVTCCLHDKRASPFCWWNLGEKASKLPLD